MALPELRPPCMPRCSATRIVRAAGLDLLQRHPRLLPGELGFAALAERQAHDLDPIAFFGVQRDRAAGAPDKISGMGTNDKTSFHEIIDSLFRLVGPRLSLRAAVADRHSTAAETWLRHLARA